MKKAIRIILFIGLLITPTVCKSSINNTELARLTNTQLLEKGKIFQQRELLDSALLYYSILNNRYNPDISVADKHLCAFSMSETGLLYFYRSNYSNAMDILLKSLQIAEDNHFEDVLCDLYKNIGNIYSSFSDFERSCTFYEKSYAIALKLKDIEKQNLILNNLVGAYCFRNDLRNANKYYQLLLKNPQNTVTYQYDTMLLKNLLLTIAHKTKEAATGYRDVKKFVENNNMGVRNLGTVNSCLGQLYETENKLDSALYFYNLNEIASRKAGQLDLLQETLKAIANIYEKKGDKQRSMAYKSEYLDLSDSLFNQRQFNSLKNAQLNYEMEKSSIMINNLRNKERENSLKITMQRNIILIVIIGCILVISLLITVYIQKRKLNNAYKDLFDRNNTLIGNEKYYKKKISEIELKLKTANSNNEIDVKPTVSTSKISDQQRAKLLEDINNIFDNNNEIFDNDFSIDRLAELIGSNTRYVSEVINDEFGKNFRTLISEYRIKEAMRRLSDQSYAHLTIRAIAESVGYKSQANFISIFTKQTGIKPSVYQKISNDRNSCSETIK